MKRLSLNLKIGLLMIASLILISLILSGVLILQGQSQLVHSRTELARTHLDSQIAQVDSYLESLDEFLHSFASNEFVRRGVYDLGRAFSRTKRRPALDEQRMRTDLCTARITDPSR